MNSKEMAKLVCHALEEKKAEDLDYDIENSQQVFGEGGLPQ